MVKLLFCCYLQPIFHCFLCPPASVLWEFFDHPYLADRLQLENFGVHESRLECYKWEDRVTDKMEGEPRSEASWRREPDLWQFEKKIKKSPMVTHHCVGYRSRQVPLAAAVWFAKNLGPKIPFRPQSLSMAVAVLCHWGRLCRRPSYPCDCRITTVECHWPRSLLPSVSYNC